jgi:REP element-mobilizing transposase RayT
MSYRRLYIPGGTYFFTLVSYRRKPIFADDERVEQLRRLFGKSKRNALLTCWRLWFYRIIIIACGAYRKAMPIFRLVGKW